MVHDICPHQKIGLSDNSTIKLQCRTCTHGVASLFDPVCRENMLHIISRYPSIDNLILNHSLIKQFKERNLDILKDLKTISDVINTYSVVYKNKNQFNTSLHQHISLLEETSKEDPFLAFQQLTKLQSTAKPFYDIYSHIQQKINHPEILQKQQEPTLFYKTNIRPYVRPGFMDSSIQIEPPAASIFIQSYDIPSTTSLTARVNLYTTQSTVEKHYFLYPPEFNLSKKELYILEKVRQKLSFHRPDSSEFLQPKHSKHYFKNFAQKTITTFLENKDITLSSSKIDDLSELFARHSSGYGIIEYLLEDDHIQDIYINAPVENNALHLVLNGEEYTSNIFLSEDDVAALASRFRGLSGKPFSEASPVLDMELSTYNTRVAAISNPLTPNGIAFALRRHRNKPWTLAHFIKNKMLTSYTAGLLSLLVDGQASLLIAGSRGAGKTSLLTALINEIPKRFRILTIEDTQEIPISTFQKQDYKIQSLVTKSMLDSDQSQDISPTNALRTALRLGESVLIIGEVRGTEATVLFEAMRVGAAGNLIMGTIHGSTTQDVYERIVYDIGVSPTSFKAVEAVVIVAPIRKEGGLEKQRRLIQISETRKKRFVDDHNHQSHFRDLMTYSTKEDALKQTDTVAIGQSELLGDIAQKWGVTIEQILENIETRAWIKDQLVKMSDKHPEVLEAGCVQQANAIFWMNIETCKQNLGFVDYSYVQKQWKQWFNDYLK